MVLGKFWQPSRSTGRRSDRHAYSHSTAQVVLNTDRHEYTRVVAERRRQGLPSRLRCA